ncbi:CoA-acylating methylmalonate-semialdehyde dehydrogenase [Saccharopolyspora elongata]|uniref:methylmalonate-semialdehyde dehydrogenase (CoA acylating) n=1 Tax=Saccharopolyspora elongata TaxID=2530387 RepID=A0A4R4Y3Y1_9PSEU|nr:CoA-acylating methylmalonate-semialdehyde dehydrogenase [Saccharopolyspora elongata]TDD38806.1 CoA-acylating methylmalonate-semialdehyde dehydrogenase [Saccharopolyspora elongata]
MSNRITHWVDGKPWTGLADRYGEVFDPARGSVTGHVAFASEQDVDVAVDAASAAWEIWRWTTLSRRARILFDFRAELLRRRDELAAAITAEHGKVLDDAHGEIARGLEVVEYACGIPALLKGGFSESVSTQIDVASIRQPLGVCALITPFNFPAMVPLWFAPIAIACGNTVVFKPSEKVPSAAVILAECWAEAGLPDGVFNVIQGDSVAVDRLLTHPDVRGVSFVGSTPVARHVYETGTRCGKRVQALGGAKNHMVVMPDADLDAAADAAVSAAYGSAGERCMAVSVVVAVEPVAEALVERITQRIAGLQTGDGRSGSDMGPLVTGAHRDRVVSYVDAGIQAGATLVVDGRETNVDGDGDGFWLGPTLFDHVSPEASIYQDEIFGPILDVVRVPSFDKALELVNASAYGNGTALFTTDGALARRYQNEVEVGMVGINVPIPVPAAAYSFGGWKSSLFGDTHAYGADGLHFFTRSKVVTTRWPHATAPRGGIDLNFPGGR